jgi:hypothetical protein
MSCRCDKIGAGVQTFRIRWARLKFRVVERLPPLREELIESRAIWACRRCGRMFAVVRIPFKDLEEILVRPTFQAASDWDWNAIASTAESVRWRGPAYEPRVLY